MPRSLSTALRTEKNKLSSPYPWLILIDLIFDHDDPTKQFYYVSNTDNVTFQGRTYTAFAFDIGTVEESIEGKIPSVSLTIANVLGSLSGVVELTAGGTNAEVVLRSINTHNIAADYADLTLYYSIMSTASKDEWIVFSLGMPSPLRRLFPPYRFQTNSCNWKVNLCECGLTGATCNSTWDRCQELGNTAYYGGHKGLTVKGWRLV